MGVPLRVLLVEDSEDDAALLLRELRHGGYDLSYERVDTSAALNNALDNQKWDLVISDHSMPHFSGIDALNILRAKGFEMPFLFVSGTIGEEAAVAALKRGAQDYLMKGNLRRLIPAIQRELREANERSEHLKLEHQVQQLHKFEAIGRLAGGIAHDFNNVIGAILGWAELCRDEAAPGTRLHERLQKIVDQTKRGADLTSQLLSFARRQVLQPRKIDLNTHVLKGVSLLRRVIGEHITVSLQTAQDLKVTMVDPTQLDQVLMNLCLNATDAMPHGGQLFVETTNAEIGTEYCRLHTDANPGEYVLLSVSDNGIGMDAETIEQIFEPFFTTKEVGKGTGLGLATVDGIVKQHGGFIDVESTSGKGTTFRVYFPAGSGAPEARGGQAEPTHKGNETILLAEDHEGLRNSAQGMLEALGYRVLVASNGLEAVQIFEAHLETIAVAVLDVVMPGLSGPDTVLRITQLRPDLRVVFTTGYTNEVASLSPLLEKGARLLQKPYSQASISQTIRAVLDHAPHWESADVALKP